MKKRYITAVCCLLAAVLTSLCASLQAQQQRLAEKLIRLHVVANSDTREDQRVKLLVRDAVLETADGLLRDAQNPEAALQTGLPELERAANEKLASLGCEETASVSLRRELFPTREYETFRLPAGVYRTLRVSIGQAGGHNWWCVVFPALCLPAAEKDFTEAWPRGGSDGSGNFGSDRGYGRGRAGVPDAGVAGQTQKNVLGRVSVLFLPM